MAKIENRDIWTDVFKCKLISIFFVETHKNMESGKIPKDALEDNELSKAAIEYIRTIVNK